MFCFCAARCAPIDRLLGELPHDHGTEIEDHLLVFILPSHLAYNDREGQVTDIQGVL